jgi:hypothetical protein
MRWFCTGHFAATWLVCSSLILRFHAASDHSVAFMVFAVVLWPVLLWLLPLKGYFRLKGATLDRLKARVRSGELKKAVVFSFGFCTSLLAAASIALTAWGVSVFDLWFSKKDGFLSMAHIFAWFPIAFLLWAAAPAFVVAKLARSGKEELPVS